MGALEKLLSTREASFDSSRVLTKILCIRNWMDARTLTIDKLLISQQSHFCFVQNLEISVASNLGKSRQFEQNLSDMIPEFHLLPFVCILSLSTVVSKCKMRKKLWGLQICASSALKNGAYNSEATEFALYVFHA